MTRNMEIRLIDGSFTGSEALALMSAIVDVKIRFHEGKIDQSENEEDIKMRERRISRLQGDLARLREEIRGMDRLQLQADLRISG